MGLVSCVAVGSFLAAALFVLVDNGSDTFLFGKYVNTSLAWDRCYTPAGRPAGDWMGCIKSVPAPLADKTRIFAILTGIWVFLGGLLQFGVALFLTCKR